MEDFKVDGEVVKTMIQECLPVVLKEKLSSSYSSPLSAAVDAELKNNDGAIKLFVKEILVSILKDEKFKDKVTNELIGLILQKGLRG